ncbi:MAG: hypothetical protein NVSMB17_15530 [Candidatus Dormibacteria bacterium]
MAARVLVFTLLLASLPVAFAGFKAAGALRRRRVLGGGPEPGLAGGRRTLVFFTGEHCSVCRHRQKPAIERLKVELGEELRVVEVDAASEPGLVRRFNVLSLPTTVLLAPDGRVGAVNYGFAPGEQLRAQVAGLA